LEDLLEQEKREQEKRQIVDSSGVSNNVSSSGSSLPSLMSDADFEFLRADVMNSSTNGTAIDSPPIIQSSNYFKFFFIYNINTCYKTINNFKVVQELYNKWVSKCICRDLHLCKDLLNLYKIGLNLNNYPVNLQLDNNSLINVSLFLFLNLINY
jgi:hypothetical protein